MGPGTRVMGLWRGVGPRVHVAGSARACLSQPDLCLRSAGSGKTTLTTAVTADCTSIAHRRGPDILAVELGRHGLGLAQPRRAPAGAGRRGLAGQSAVPRRRRVRRKRGHPGVHLEAPAALLDQRCAERGSTQDPSWWAGRAIKANNLADRWADRPRRTPDPPGSRCRDQRPRPPSHPPRPQPWLPSAPGRILAVIDLRLRTPLADEDAQHLAGKVIGPDDYDVLLTGPAFVRMPTGKPLCIYTCPAPRERWPTTSTTCRTASNADHQQPRTGQRNEADAARLRRHASLPQPQSAASPPASSAPWTRWGRRCAAA